MNSNNTDDLQSDIDDHRGQNTLLGQNENCSNVWTRDYDPTTTSHNNVPSNVPQRRPTTTSHNIVLQQCPTIS